MRKLPEADEPVPDRSGEIHNRVGATLRRAYDEVATETLPPEFEDLLKQLQ